MLNISYFYTAQIKKEFYKTAVMKISLTLDLKTVFQNQEK